MLGMKHKWRIICCLLFFAAAAYQLEKTTFFATLQNTFQDKSVPSGILNYGAMGKVLRESGLVKIVPQDHVSSPSLGGKSLIRILLQTDIDTHLTIFWSAKKQDYSGKRSSTIPVSSGKKEYALAAPALSGIYKLRIDPATAPARIRIYQIIIEQVGEEPILFTPLTGLKHVKVISGIADLKHDSKGIYFKTINSDPQIELHLNHLRKLENLAFQRKRKKTNFQYFANPSLFEGYPSSGIIKKEDFKKNWPIISIVAEEDDLYHPDKGIISNKMSRGRFWERPAYVSYFDENGKLLFGSMAGLRIHGGLRIQLYNSFRLHFRKEYGVSWFPEFRPKLKSNSKPLPLEKLVIHHTAWPPGGWFFNNTLAYDIARRIGCIVPETKLALLFVNGIERGIYFLTPQINRKLLTEYLGHDNFVTYKYRSDNSWASETFYIRYFWYKKKTREKLTLEELSKYIDPDNLARHMFSMIFCGTTDFCQGTVVLDKSKPGNKLFWVNWDMDHSFIDWPGQPDTPIWAQAAWSIAYRQQPPYPSYCKRIELFSRLLNEDPEYRNYVVLLGMNLLNHRINSEFLQYRLQYYDEMLRNYGIQDSDYMKQLDIFFKKRPAFIRDEMRKLFDLGPSLPCRVKGPVDIAYLIDGYPESNNYQGYYFENKPIEISITSFHEDDFSHWLVNGEKIKQYPLTYKITSKTIIEPIFNDA